MDKFIKLRNIFLIVSIIALTVQGCDTKEEVVKKPEIILVNPTSNETFNVFDTIRIKVEIRHTRSMKNVGLSVTNVELKPVISDKNISITGTLAIIDTFLIIDNKYIEDGQHYLHLTIDDSKNLFNSWFPLNITPLTKKLQNILLVSGEDNQNDLIMLHDTNEQEKILSWNSEYQGGYVDSRFMMFYTLGSLSFGLRGYSILNHSLVWSDGAQPNGSLPYFTSFSAIEGKVSTGLWDGSVCSYNENGLKIFSSPAIAGGRFSNILNLKDHIAGIFKPFNQTVNKLIIYNYPAGNVYHSIELEGEPVNIFMVDDKTILVLLTVDNILKSYYYKTEDKTLYFIQNVTSFPVLSASGDGHEIFLTTGNNILWYRPGIYSVSEYLSIVGVSSLFFEPIESALYVSVNEEIRKFYVPSDLPSSIIIPEQPVKDILFLYNK